MISLKILRLWHIGSKIKILIFLSFTTVYLTVEAQSINEGWKIEDWTPGSPWMQDLESNGIPADAPLNTSQIRTNSIASASSVVATNTTSLGEDNGALIQSIARGLNNDPLNIYNWVLTHVEFRPYYGLRQGAYATALALSGNDFDQAVLLVSLLKAAGISGSAIEYEFGSVTYSETDIKSWIQYEGLPLTKYNLDALGFPSTLVSGGISIPRIWVRVQLPAGTYYLDPSFKHSRRQTRVELSSLVSSYSPSGLVALAGGSEAPLKGGGMGDEYYGANVDQFQSGLASVATSYARNARSQYPGLSVKDLLGLPTLNEPAVTALPTQPVSSDYTVWTEIPLDYSSKLKIEFNGVNQMINWCDLKNDILEIRFDANGRAILYRNNTVLASEGSYDPTSLFHVNVTFSFAPTNSIYQYPIQSVPIARIGQMVIQGSTGPAHGRYMDLRAKLQDIYTTYGATNSYTMAANLALVGLQRHTYVDNCLAVVSALNDKIISNTCSMWFYSSQSGTWQVDGEFSFSSQGDLRPTSYSWQAVKTAAGTFFSSSEHLTLEMATGKAARSSTKVMESALRDGYELFRLTKGNWTTLSPQIVGGLFTPIMNWKINDADESINGNVVTASHAKVPIYGSSAGMYGSACITGRTYSGGFIAVSYYITGGLNGGQTEVGTSLISANVFSDNSVHVDTNSQITHLIPASNDPVDLTTGAFLYEHTDLSLAGDGLASSLNFTRSYSSVRRLLNPVDLGFGWTHNYDLSVGYHHGNDLDIGTATVGEIAPLVVATRFLSDFLTADYTAKQAGLSCSAVNWAGAQYLNSKATVSLGGRQAEFTRLPDGSFEPPSSMPATLTKLSDGSHTLAIRHGNTYNFRAVDGKCTSIVDPDSNTLSLVYNSSKLLSTVTDAFGRTLSFTYSGGKLSKVLDSSGRFVTFANPNSTSQTVTDAEGKTTTFGIDSRNRLTSITDALNRVTVVNNYDDFDRVVDQYTFGDNLKHWSIGYAPYVARETDPLSNTAWTYFNPRWDTVGYTDALNHTTQSTYDGIDRLISSTTPATETTSYTYDVNHEVTSVTDPELNTRLITPESNDSVTSPRVESNFEGQQSTITYFADHRVKDVTQPGNMVTSYTYDSRGRISTVHPASFEAGKVINYTYDNSAGYTKRVIATYPDATTEIFDYDAAGNIIQFIDRLSKKTTSIYNNRAQPLQIAQWTGIYSALSLVGGTPPAGSLVKNMVYDDAGNLQTETVDGKVTTYSHDALGHMTTVTGPDGVVQADNYYDVRNLLAYSMDAYGFATSYHYDDAQRINQVYDPVIRPTQYDYDADGRRYKVTTPRGYVTTDHYTPTGFKDTTTDAKQNVITFHHDKDGRLTTLIDRNTKPYTTVYDDANRTVTSKTPLNKSSVEVKNTRGLIDSITEPSLQCLNNTVFDAEGRVKTQVYKDSIGSVVATKTFAYYANGLLYTVTETPASGSAHTTTRTYDDLNRLKSYNDGEGNLLQYQYDNSGNLYQLIYPDNKTVTYDYDAYNRMRHVTDWSNRVTTYSYDDDGRLTRIDRPNGTWRKMLYDAAGQLRQAEEHKTGSNGAMIWLGAYQYDNVSNDQNFHQNDGEITWSYNYPTSHAFTLPADIATYDDDNRLLTWAPGGGGAQNPVFDEDGNMTAGPLPSGLPGSYSYDTRNRLIGVGGQSYRYNPDGNRVQVDSTTYVVDPAASLSRVLVRNQGGTITRYVWGIGLIYEETGTSTLSYHPNHQGSTVALTDDGGNVTDRLEYAPYGSITYRAGTSDTPFLLHGALGVMTDTNGLNYMRARYYNPRIMRFVNADPIGFGGGPNWYAFAGNNPISLTDPSGFCQQGAGMSSAQRWGTMLQIAGNLISSQDRMAGGLISNLGGNISVQDSVAGGINATFNPAYNVMAGSYQAATGLSLNSASLGQTLSTGERVFDGFTATISAAAMAAPALERSLTALSQSPATARIVFQGATMFTNSGDVSATLLEGPMFEDIPVMTQEITHREMVAPSSGPPPPLPPPAPAPYPYPVPMPRF